MRYNPKKIEQKWQKVWEGKKLHEAKDTVSDRKNYMLLTEFPYPSGNLHIGHWYAFAVPDILARLLKMRGFNVLYPIGFDAFGLPAENAAIKRNINPRDWTEKNVSYMTKQLKSMGASFDWSRAVSTIDPEYYKWTQWMFIKMRERGLAYRAKTKVNWCPKDKTVLANEQVVGGLCERCDATVEQKEVEQWMFKITEYADRLIDDIEGLDWPEATKLAQKNWIGRSEGALIKFKILWKSDFHGGKSDTPAIEIFTTRPDTLFGATYMVLAPEHGLIEKCKSQIANYEEVRKYILKAKNKTEEERVMREKEKTGVELRGIKAVNPANNEEIPVWVADYVLGNVGTGAIMAVPAHDERDFAFAQKFDLPIKMVVCPNWPEKTCPVLDRAYEGEGHLVDSGKFDGMPSEKARWVIAEFVGGAKKIQYRLHDWVLSRQRYWGVPIPMVKCGKCGYVPVPETELPVKLPPLKDFKPSDDGRSPLAKAIKWVKAKCPKCGGEAERETDTMDTFVDSSWYFLRYTDPKNRKKFADPKKIKLWLPVSMYIGGAEHNTMHLLYSRFFTKALFGLGLVGFSEPFTGRRNHGTMLGPDGQKMSKSRGNVVDPDKEVAKFGADTVRMYLAFMGPYDQGGPWSPGGITGIYRFLNRVWNFFVNSKTHPLTQQDGETEGGQNPSGLQRLIHKTIKKAGEDVEALHFNTAISALMVLLNEFEKNKETVTQYDLKIYLHLLAPFAPHMAEELFQQFFGISKFQVPISKKNPKFKFQKTLIEFKSVHTESWPEFNASLIKDEAIELVIQVNGKVRGKASVSADITEESAIKAAFNSEGVKKYLENGYKKAVFVKGRLVNFVI